MTRPTISACLMVRNEAQLLGHCLRSIAPLCHQIVVVDLESTDRTRAIARAAGAQVVSHHPTSDYVAPRNLSLSLASGDWILVVDPDERIAARDIPEISRLVRRRETAGYRLLVRNYTRDFNITWNWHANDGRYPAEERASRCPGWTLTRALRLFRNVPQVAYPAYRTAAAHITPERSLARAGGIETCDTVAVHHYECLKRGGPSFIRRKQQRRLDSELARANGPGHDRDAFVNAAKTLFAQRRDREASALLRRAIRRYPEYRDAHHLQGLIDLESGRLEPARRRFRKAVAIEPRSADSWALLGVVCVEAGRTDEAASALERALALQPTHLVARNSLGVLCEDLGRRRDADYHYRAALRLHPGFAPARANLRRLKGSAE